MDMTIWFPGGKRVDAEVDGQVVRTDQLPKAGGEGSAPEPYAHFIASIGTCAGIYVLSFCQARNIPTDGIRLIQHMDFDTKKHLLSRVHIEIQLPPDFPDKYRDAVQRAADYCTVKRTIMDPPQFEISATTVEPGQQAEAAEG